VAIIGMIATMVTPQVLGYLGRAKGETARIQVKNIAQAVPRIDEAAGVAHVGPAPGRPARLHQRLEALLGRRVIATMVTPQVLGYLGRAKGETARIQVKNIAQAVELYYLDLGAYPNLERRAAAAGRAVQVGVAPRIDEAAGVAHVGPAPKAGGSGDQSDVASN
jgi:general secretion pathway protein G